MKRRRQTPPMNQAPRRVRRLLPVLALLAFCSCQSSERPTGKPLTIDPSIPPEQITSEQTTVWAWNIAAAALKDLVTPEQGDIFHQRHPNVNVFFDRSGANLQSRFLLSLSAGVGAPDVSQLEQSDAPKYTITGRLTDLTPIAEKHEKSFPPAIWRNCKHDGKIYAIPWDVGPCAVFYKRGIFKKYGLDPDAIETWDDYIEVGKVLLEKSRGKTKICMLYTGGMENMFEMLLQQAGGQVFDDEGRVAVNSPAALRVLKLLKRMAEAGITANLDQWGHTGLLTIDSESVATYPMAVWWGGTIKDNWSGAEGAWGVFRLPALEPGGLRTSNLGGSVLVIPDQCENKEAAWAFIEFALCTVEAQILQYRHWDLFPAYLPAHQDAFFDTPDPFYGGQKAGRLFALDIEKIPPMNRTKDFKEARRYYQQALSKWATDDFPSPEKFLENLEYRMGKRLGRKIAPGSLSEKNKHEKKARNPNIEIRNKFKFSNIK